MHAFVSSSFKKRKSRILYYVNKRKVRLTVSAITYDNN